MPVRPGTRLPHTLTDLADVINRLDEEIRGNKKVLPSGWTLARHLARTFPADAVTYGRERAEAVADEMKWGKRDDDGQLDAADRERLHRAFGIYCQWLDLPEADVPPIPTGDRS